MTISQCLLTSQPPCIYIAVIVHKADIPKRAVSRFFRIARCILQNPYIAKSQKTSVFKLQDSLPGWLTDCWVFKTSGPCSQSLIQSVTELHDIKNERIEFNNISSKINRMTNFVYLSACNTHINLFINPLYAALNPICHLLALLGAHHILHVSRIRVNTRHWIFRLALVAFCLRIILL